MAGSHKNIAMLFMLPISSLGVGKISAWENLVLYSVGQQCLSQVPRIVHVAVYIASEHSPLMVYLSADLNVSERNSQNSGHAMLANAA